jgi:proline iminopeptidase
MESDTYTIEEQYLDVGDGHTLYMQDWGNKSAKNPVIFLHGGPGGGCKEKHKKAFDPTKQRVIFFDQRGCGKSTPYGSLEHNTTQDLVQDISKIADTLKLDTFVLHGTSWGSTLALVYAIDSPSRVTALVIGGVFTGSFAEIAWLDQGLFQTFFPDAWQDYLSKTPIAHHDKPTAYHFKTVLEGTPEEQKKSAYAYGCLEGAVMQLDDRTTPDIFEDYDPADMRIEMYYMQNNCFLPDKYVFDNASKLTMPVYIVQGRYDMVCPPEAAYKLHILLPNSELYWALSGHKTEHENQNIFTLLLARATA